MCVCISFNKFRNGSPYAAISNYKWWVLVIGIPNVLYNVSYIIQRTHCRMADVRFIRKYYQTFFIEFSEY